MMAGPGNKNNYIRTLNIDYQLILLYRIGLLMFLFSMARVGFYLFNTEHFSDMTFIRFLKLMWGGLKFDISAIMFLNAFYLIFYLLPLPFRYNKTYQSIFKWIFIVSNGIALATNIADFFYFDFILKRSSADVFMFAQEGNILTLGKLFLIDYWQGLVFWIIQVALLIYGYGLFKPEKYAKPIRWKFYLSGLVWLLISIYFAIIGMRGGFTRTTRPITLGNAGTYTERPLEMAIVLNTPFAIMKTLDKTELPEITYFTPEELKAIYEPVHLPDSGKTFKPLNVVVLVMESFAREYVGGLNKHLEDGNYQGYTPFLDSLIALSKSYPNAFANGIKSIDALPSVVTSIPSIVQPYVTSNYATNEVTSIANLLKPKGYETVFFHGAPNGSMGFDSFMKVAGYEKYIGMSEYGNDADFDGSWGIWDEEFMQFMESEMNKLQQPFHSVFFSTSSHHPFKIPERYKGKFKPGTNDYHIPVQYTDMALRKFFKKASQEPWFQNTLFVITADHSGPANHPEYNNAIGNYAVPILFYHPGNPDFKGMDSTVVQQADILPGIMHYLNYDQKFISFGADIFNPETKHFNVSYNNNSYQIIEGDWMLQFSEEKTTAFYHYKEDPELKNNLVNQALPKQAEMEKLLKAFIQDYNNRMIRNQLARFD